MIKSEYNILIPFDFSDHGIELTKNVIRHSENSNVRIHLLHVVKKGTPIPTVNDILAHLKDFVNPSYLFIEIIEGDTSECILNYSKKINASVMFISNTQDSNYKYNYVGPVACNIMEHADCPVIVLKNELVPESIKTILLPLNINAENKLKISTAIFFARFFNNAIVRIVSVVFDIDDYSLNKTVYRLQHLTHFIEKSGVECVGEIIRCSEEENENIEKAVVDYSYKSEAEMVVLMAGKEDSQKATKKNQEEPHLTQQAMYMISHLKNNVISITPQLKKVV